MDFAMKVVAAGAAVSLAMSLVACVCVLIAVRRRRPPGPLPPISVFKPLCGLEDGLYENLRSIVEQQYPRLQIVFGAESSDDPALAVARRIARENPRSDIAIVAGTRPFGLNPKVRNLAGMMRQAKYDHVLVSDSNVRAAPDYVLAVARELSDDRVGLVSSVLVGTGGGSLGSRIENLHLNSFIAMSVCAAATLAHHPCVVGKSMLFDRRRFEAVGGWSAVANVLAEDYVLGQRFVRAGFRVALSGRPLATRTSRRTVADFMSRHLRWSQMRRRISPTAFVAEFVLCPTVWLVTLLCLGFSAQESSGLASAIGGLALKAALDLTTARAVGADRVRPTDLPLVLAKDLLVIGVWVVAAFRRTVRWRGHELRIGDGSVLTPAAPSPTLDGVRAHAA